MTRFGAKSKAAALQKHTLKKARIVPLLGGSQL